MRVAIALLIPSIALAGPDPFDVRGPEAAVEAKTLFDEGRALVDENKQIEACAKFRASWKIEQAAGTALNLADCEQRAGAYREAWSLFDFAARESERKANHVRASFARTRADALVPKLGRVLIRFSQMSKGIVVRVDGRRLTTANEVVDFVTPGAFEVRVNNATHRFEFAKKVEAGATVTIDVPPMVEGTPIVQPTAPPEPPPTTIVWQVVDRWNKPMLGIGISLYALGTASGAFALFSDTAREASALASITMLASGIVFTFLAHDTVEVRTTKGGASVSMQVRF